MTDSSVVTWYADIIEKKIANPLLNNYLVEVNPTKASPHETINALNDVFKTANEAIKKSTVEMHAKIVETERLSPSLKNNGKYSEIQLKTKKGLSIEGNQGRAALFDLAKLGLDALHSLTVSMMLDVRTRADILQFRGYISDFMANTKGVLITRHSGFTPNGAGAYLVEYLGISIRNSEEKFTNVLKAPTISPATGKNICTFETEAYEDLKKKLAEYDRHGFWVDDTRPKNIGFEEYTKELLKKRDYYLQKNPTGEKRELLGGVLSYDYLEEQCYFLSRESFGKLLNDNKY